MGASAQDPLRLVHLPGLNSMMVSGMRVSSLSAVGQPRRFPAVIVSVFLSLLCYVQPAIAVTGAKLTPHEVCWLQDKLRNAGFYRGTVDGVRGPNTNNAIEDYARRHRLQDLSHREIVAHVLANPRIRSGSTASPVPRTGQQFTRAARNSIAPLQIATSDDRRHYFVKVTPPGSTESVATVFIRSGEQTEIRVPPGRYVIKYAVGTAWYGANCLFGMDTSFHQADQVLYFERDGDRISGYRIELIPQTSGNLRTTTINSNNF